MDSLGPDQCLDKSRNEKNGHLTSMVMESHQFRNHILSLLDFSYTFTELLCVTIYINKFEYLSIHLFITK